MEVNEAVQAIRKLGKAFEKGKRRRNRRTVRTGDAVRIISALRAPMIPFTVALPKPTHRTYAPPSVGLLLFMRKLR